MCVCMYTACGQEIRTVCMYTLYVCMSHDLFDTKFIYLQDMWPRRRDPQAPACMPVRTSSTYTYVHMRCF